MNQKVIITRGLSGSGKTTWSNKFVRSHNGYLRVSRDDIDFMLSGDYFPRKEYIVFETRNFLIRQILGNQLNLVLDETFLVPNRIEGIMMQLKNYVYETGNHLDIKIKDFIDVPIERCIERDKQRFFHVGEKFIRDYHKNYIESLLKDPGVTKWTI